MSAGNVVTMQGEALIQDTSGLPDMEDLHARRYFDRRAKVQDGIFECGEVLLGAKAELPRGRWLPFLKRINLSSRHAERLMRIARDANLLRHRGANSTRESNLLPLSVNALYALTDLEPERFAALVRAGRVRPETTAGEVKIALADLRHGDPAFTPPPLETLPEGIYRAILADPPWRFETWSDKGKGRSADAHYPTMTAAELKAMGPAVRVRAAADCLLFLWVPAGPRREAEAIMEAWGFEVVGDAFTWVKPGRPGLGYWTRKRTEVCVLGRRGKPKRLAADLDDVIEAPRGRHSEKPAEVYERIERLVAGPYLELFARHAREGWEAWGNDPNLPGDEEAAR